MKLRTAYNNNRSPIYDIDWITIMLYLILVVAGAISIYAASYQFDNVSMLEMSQFSGKQFMWIGISLLIGFCIMLLDKRFYEDWAYPIYALITLLLILTIFIAPNIKGSHSWIVIGPISIQPAEFGKFATALALAKLFSSYNFSLNDSINNYLKAVLIIVLPIILIICQKETGSALVYTSLIFVLYREGMSGFILFAGLCAVVFFIVIIKYTEIAFWGIPLGESIVFIMIMAIIVGMLLIYCRSITLGRNTAIGFAALSVIAVALSYFGVEINGTIFFIGAISAVIIYIIVSMFIEKVKRAFVTIIFAITAIIFMFSVNFAFGKLESYQQMRVKVALGIEEDIRGVGYNVNQSKIAIGSGGLTGKGFLNGTQTKLKYVPEQHTDFIFCTIGEEEGFLGSSAVLILFLILILRIIYIAERQRTTFARVYAYCVASYFIFHLSINIGMVIGLCPVIGIPLPFFSYGGSSILGFTILLSLLLRMDASRREYVN